MNRSTSPTPALLVVVAQRRAARRLPDDIGRLGWHPIVVSQPLDVIVHLQSSAFTIAAIIAPECETHFKTCELFRFMHEAFPAVRRIAYRMQEAASIPEREGAAVDHVLSLPLPLHRLRSAIGAPPKQPAPESACGNDVRTGEKLLEAWHVASDRGAFNELDRRYRGRILRAAAHDGYNAADAEDIAQETLLGVFLSTTSQSPPDTLITGLTTASCVALERGQGRRQRLAGAIAAEAGIRRRGLESRSKPDVHLQAGELADRARASIASLPGQCKRPFSLCAAHGMTARQAGAELDILPGTVNMWVRRARELIAGDIALASR